MNKKKTLNQPYLLTQYFFPSFHVLKLYIAAIQTYSLTSNLGHNSVNQTCQKYRSPAPANELFQLLYTRLF